VQRQCSGRVLPSWLAGGRATNVRAAGILRALARAPSAPPFPTNRAFGEHPVQSAPMAGPAPRTPPHGSRDPFWWSGGGWPPAGSNLRKQPRVSLSTSFLPEIYLSISIYLSIYLSLEPSAPTGCTSTSWCPRAGRSADGRAPHGVGPSGARGRRRLDVSRHRHSDRPTSCGATAGGGGGRRRRRSRRRRQRRSCCWAQITPISISLSGAIYLSIYLSIWCYRLQFAPRILPPFPEFPPNRANHGNVRAHANAHRAGHGERHGR
jgi:hypothetical protein